jgi:hypothetical protein
MLERREYLHCLKFFNEAVRETHPELVLADEELFKLTNKGKFGPPGTLTRETLLSGLFRQALPRFMPSNTPPSDAPTMMPSAATTQVWQCRYIVRQCGFAGRAFRLPGEIVLGPDIAGGYLTAARSGETVHFTTEELFNAFLALNLHWTLRDLRGRCVRLLSDTEADDWRSNGESGRQGRWLSLYPSRRDRKKIFQFIEIYGYRFLSYPPNISPISDEWIARLKAIPCGPWHFLAGPYPGGLLARWEPPNPFFALGLPQVTDLREALMHPNDPSPQNLLMTRLAARQWAASGWDFLSEFNYQYQTFTRIVRCLLDRPLTPRRQDLNAGRKDSVRQALWALTRGLKGVTLDVSQEEDGTVVTSVNAELGLQSCYALLWETLPRGQRALLYCALPTCRGPFTPQRSDQVCCSPRCARALRSRRHRAKHTRR